MDKKKFRFYYGIILIAVGVGVFYRIPQVVPRIETIEFLRQKIGIVKACSYLLGAFLIIAGGIRIYKNYK